MWVCRAVFVVDEILCFFLPAVTRRHATELEFEREANLELKSAREKAEDEMKQAVAGVRVREEEPHKGFDERTRLYIERLLCGQHLFRYSFVF